MNTVQNLYDINRNREVIFIESIKELIIRINSKQRTPYNLVRKAAILRFLIIEGSNFFQIINKSYKLDIKFKIKKGILKRFFLSTLVNENKPYVITYYKLDSLGEDININKFLKLPIIKTNDQYLKSFLNKNHIAEEYNIRQVIKLVANAHGGVHIEEWGNDIPGYMMTDDTSPFNINSNSNLHDILDNISEIVIKTLEPLSKKVVENLKLTNAISWETPKWEVKVKN